MLGAKVTGFEAARELLLELRTDYERAYREFSWPALDHFNWGLDWFDELARRQPDKTALRVVRDSADDEQLTYAEMRVRSDQVANFLRSYGVRRGDPILLMLPNVVPLWEVMLAATKLGAVMIPASTLLMPDDLRDRLDRGQVRHVVAAAAETPKFNDLPADQTRICVGEKRDGWIDYADSQSAFDAFEPDGETKAADPLLRYFTSGTTALPKLVEHTHQSYPVGHLSTMYWIGLQPDDVHLNISSPGWAKHAWSNVFAPWNAGCTALVYDYARFSATAFFDVLERCGVTTLCAPPTVWRLVIQAQLPKRPSRLRELISAGEPLNPEVIQRVEAAWGITIRDGYGQTETTAQIGNPPGQRVKPGSMGRPLPGYRIELLDLNGQPSEEGEISIDLSSRPLPLMTGYRDDPQRTAEVTRGGYYHTGDVASRDADGYVTYVGRADDVFKSSDYRISPFELESVLLEHPAVAEAAVVPSPDPVRLSVPKAYVVCAAEHEPSRETAFEILRFARERLAPYKRVRRLEFAELPKTISGKIRRVELREAAAASTGNREYRDDEFPELRG